MSWIERYMEIDATKTPAEGREIFVVAKSHSKHKRGRKVFDTTQEFAQKPDFVCRRRTAIIDVRRKVATICCPGLWFA
jgi:hypothetical protein